MVSAIGHHTTENIVSRLLGTPASLNVQTSHIPSRYRVLDVEQVGKIQQTARATLNEFTAHYTGAEAICRNEASWGLLYGRAQELAFPDENPIIFFNGLSAIQGLVFYLGVLTVSRATQVPDAQEETDALLHQYKAMQERAKFFRDADCYSGAPFERLLDEYKDSPTKTIDQVKKILAEFGRMCIWRSTDAKESREAFLRPLLGELMDTIGDFQWNGHTLAALIYQHATATPAICFKIGDHKTVRQAAFADLSKLLEGISQVEKKLLAPQK